jgi:hypothetical protein
VTDDDKCEWILPSGKPCDRTAVRGDYCWTHWPLAIIGYKRKPHKVKQASVEQLRRQFQPELETKENKAIVLVYKRQDFPRHIEGIWFESYEDYIMYNTGRDFIEMASTEQELLEWRVPKQRYLPLSSSTHVGGELQSLISYKAKPRVSLGKGTWRIVESIEHMRYVVLRQKDGRYYSVWLSLIGKTDADFALCAVLKHHFPIEGVVRGKGFNFHVSSPKANFDAAEGSFHRGGESAWRIRQRIKNAHDPNWIPPNLRKLAVAGQMSLIPAAWRPRLRQWMGKGSPGWWGSKKADTRPWYSRTN